MANAGAPTPALAGAERRCLLLLCLFLLTAYTLTMAGRLVSGDGEAMYLTTRALVTRGELSIEQRPEAAQGRDGRYYSKYGLGQSLAQAPFFVVGHLVGKLFDAPDDRPARFAVSLTNSVVTTALAALLWLAFRAFGCTRRRATLGVLTFAFGTLAWPYARADFAEPLQATLLMLAFYALLRWRRVTPSSPTPGGGGTTRGDGLPWLALAGAAAGGAVLTKAASVVLLPALALYLAVALWERAACQARAAGGGARGAPTGVARPAWPVGLRPAAAAILAAALPLAACVAIQAALNAYRFGSVIEFGYGDEPATGFRTPLLAGIGYLTISSGKGLFWFAPPVAMGLMGLGWLARRYRLEALTIALIFVAELGYYARWWAWHGDWSWGPRYMVVTVPFIMLGWTPVLVSWPWLALPARAAAGLTAAAGLVVSSLGVAIDYGAYYSIIAYQLGRGVDVAEARLVPAFSPLLGHAWLARATLYDTVADWTGTRAPRDRAENPFLHAYPWAGVRPDLRPEAPERALGFDLWFAALRDAPPFAQYWCTLVACWLALALVPLGRRLMAATSGARRGEAEVQARQKRHELELVTA
jgi:hypothetical protein